jgi:two-component system response regulator
MRKLVLLVEDNPSDEKLTLRALSKAGVATEVAVARDGVEALEFLWLHGPTSPTDADLPAIVLLDLKLPRVDGLEVLRRIRADIRTQLVPVIVLTSSTLDEDRLAAYSMGANAYVRKQVDFSAFVAAAQTLGDFWLRLNEPPPATRGSP